MHPETGSGAMAALHGSQAPAGKAGDFTDGLGIQVGDLMLPRVGPDVFDQVSSGA